MLIGSDIPRVDGLDKLTGRTRFVDDIPMSGVWHGGVVRSTIPRGRIKSIRFDRTIDWDTLAVVDHRDLPGPNVVKLIESDQPVLAADRVLHKYEPIVLLAHPSKAVLARALRAVHIEYEPLPPVLDPRQALTGDLIQYGSDNVFKRIDIRKGDPSGVFASAAHVVEGQYVTGAQEHVYLETQGMIAYCDDGAFTVIGSMQCPYYVVESLAALFGRDQEAFRVVQAPVGGGFGGKEEYPSVLAAHACLLAHKAGAPVKIVYDRGQDMAVTTKRHPAFVSHRTALDGDGRLLAMEVSVLLDGGAYVTLSPVVLSRGTIHAAGPYACDHIHVHGEARLTNSPPYGAFRGFGAPQTIFAMERHMDRCARWLGIDPAELRRRNLLADGETMATGQVYRDGVDLVGLVNQTLASADYDEKLKAHDAFNRSHAYLRRGVGLATFHHGAGFTGAGEVFLASEVRVRGLADGRVEVLTAQTDMGQGTSTILAQIAGEALGLPEGQVVVAQPDTSRVPNSGPTVASRTAMVVGRLVAKACANLQGLVGDGEPLSGVSLQEGIRAWHSAHPGDDLVAVARYEKPDDVSWDEKRYRGDAYASYAWACYVADVEVDLRTYSVRVRDFLAAQDVGRVLNPTLARGQIAGGVVQGIGWSLYEEVVLDEGVMTNAQLTNYIIPGSGDLPPIRVVFGETPSKHGPGGAKGIGELPMDGPAPAIINAVCRALGVEIDCVPLMPERLMTLLDEST